MRLSRLLVLLTLLACLCASAQASIGEFGSAAKSARRGFLPEPATASRAIDRATAGRVWEKSWCGSEATSGSCVDAFGVEIGRTGTTNVEHLYRGERFDANAGFYDLRARLYIPQNGRFLTQDSFAGFGSNPLSLHKYSYAHNDPVNHADPTGFNANMVETSTVSNIAVLQSSFTVGRVGVVGAIAANDAAFAASLTAVQKGLLVIAATGAAGASLYALLTDEEDSDDEPVRHKLYHGTDIATARMLASGAPISIDPDKCNWDASCGGFYMADHLWDAEHFAQFTQQGMRDGGVVQYNFTSAAYTTIMAISTKRPIPQARRYWPQGNEIVLPPSGFAVFNGLLAQRKIIASPVVD